MEGNNLKIRPLFDNVVVRKDEIEEKSKTGIIITGSDDQPALVGIVLSVGRDVEDQIKPGDKIMYAPFSGRELGGFLILAQHDIMGVLEEEKEKQEIVGGTRKMQCKKCGTTGFPIFGQKCPNCGEAHWSAVL